jgi:hypothetical protein
MVDPLPSRPLGEWVGEIRFAPEVEAKLAQKHGLTPDDSTWRLPSTGKVGLTRTVVSQFGVGVSSGLTTA